MKITFILILFSLHSVLFCQNLKPRYNFDFDKEWQWNQLFDKANNEDTFKELQKLKEILSIHDARFIFYQLSRLAHPMDIKAFSEMEKNQSEWGGGFYGIVPAHFSNMDSIPQPLDFDNLIKTALYLAKIRSENYAVIAKSNFDYPLTFSNNKFPVLTNGNIIPNLHLDLDFSVIQELLKFFNKKEITSAEAQLLASNKINTEMLRHRRELGYIPEPLPDSTDLARFIFHAASKEPLDQIWKWLNPWNDFCLSDLYLFQKKYQKLVNTLVSHSQDITNHILSRISLFLPDAIYYSDRVCFAVNWGVRSWATENTLGTNIVQFKDDYEKMLRTLTHETFHRVQLKICPVDSSRNINKSFEGLAYHNFPEKEDRKFYETLSYIMLEGTATYVGGVDTKWEVKEKMLEGKGLLEQLVSEVYKEHNLENSEKLLNKGLRSNGPFYGLGYFMTKTIVKELGEKEIGRLLKGGCISFFEKYIEISDRGTYSKDLKFSHETVRKIKKIHAFF